MKRVLLLAGIYNLVWGLVAIASPGLMFDLVGMERPRYPELWQCIGMIVGVYGVGYLAAASAPLRHWPIVLVGFLGKIFGPIGFLGALIKGSLPIAFGATLLTNDLVWWVPFGAILLAAFKQNTTLPDVGGRPDEAFNLAKTDQGQTLAELSQQRPVFTVLLRHAGCTFHREALADLKRAEPQIDAIGAQLAIVHMGDGPNTIETQRDDYDLSDIPHVSDPDRTLYRQLGLPRGKLSQLFGWKEFVRGARACLVQRHGVGTLKGDGFQLGGLALLDKGTVTWDRPLESASERPDYIAEAQAALQSC